MSRIQAKSLALLGVLVTGALAAGALGGAPIANASCASFFGIGNTAHCTSSQTSIAIAIGTNAEAHADGLFGSAFSLGTQAAALTVSSDAFDFATAVGDNSIALSGGIFGIATALGPNGDAITAGKTGNLGLNIAVDISAGTTTLLGSIASAAGAGNIAVNFFGNGTTGFGQRVIAKGILNVATALGGHNNKVQAGIGGNLNMAFAVLGTNNYVQSGKGPAAIAGSILQTNALIYKDGPGFNINGLVVGGAAAIASSKPAAPSGTTHTLKKANVPSASSGRSHKV